MATTPTPLFSWALPPSPAAASARAFQLQIFPSARLHHSYLHSDPLCDSGVITGAQQQFSFNASLCVLAETTTYAWAVRAQVSGGAGERPGANAGGIGAAQTLWTNW